MKIELALLIIIFINIALGTNQYIYITPQNGNSCNDGTTIGGGFVVPVNQCIKINKYSALFEQNENNVFVSWFNDCSDHNSFQINNYTIDSCTNFILPHTTSTYLSTISNTGVIPPQSIVFQYYNQTEKVCSNELYKQYYTVDYTEKTFEYHIDYLCSQNQPFTYLCTRRGNCYSTSYQGCNFDKNHPYSYTVTC
ncbi:hypothetical protein DICPUDRAFT_79533 [Dictyostelium purpureum]|uniref:Chitin-binding type-2 domain-containing protein n=1 Tax=Dictyostelium purpureum TaxID=5786 RepID=F0ZMV6_DICPU|nr:uncharacterized protein DICPUDRAFT_79533 [Dictyostelium purpureum]EGC34708.1 hypothetical protein DICPUDRAFT_79533 [Dictyostelium purpureum]|eukprot:XP_003288749.1 hypothetical protein DICPUDRAFT_79533 [Dictyostelium purpureum]